jgi:succinyl-CoA synthetase beta subunit
LLKGFRGRELGDVEALAHAIMALSQLAVRPDLGVVECEINPLIVRAQGRGVVAVDACAWISQHAAPQEGA